MSLGEWARTPVAVALVLSCVLAAPQALEAQTGGQIVVPTREYHLGEEDKLEITVNIWGEVERPGSYRVPDDTNLVELISLAGGPTDYADLSRVKITRPNGRGDMLIEVNLSRYLDGKPGEEATVLLPGDTVRVPRNAKHAWRSAIQVLSDVAAIATLYVIIKDRRYR